MNREEQQLWVDILHSAMYNEKCDINYSNELSYAIHNNNGYDSKKEDVPYCQFKVDICKHKYPIFVVYCSHCRTKTIHSIGTRYIHAFCNCNIWQLNDLPEDIWFHIFQYIDPMQLVKIIPKVCKRLCQLTQKYWIVKETDAATWWYNIGLPRKYVEVTTTSSYLDQMRIIGFPVNILYKNMPVVASRRDYDRCIHMNRCYYNNKFWLIPYEICGLQSPYSTDHNDIENILNVRAFHTATHILNRLHISDYLKRCPVDRLYAFDFKEMLLLAVASGYPERPYDEDEDTPLKRHFESFIEGCCSSRRVYNERLKNKKRHQKTLEKYGSTKRSKIIEYASRITLSSPSTDTIRKHAIQLLLAVLHRLWKLNIDIFHRRRSDSYICSKLPFTSQKLNGVAGSLTLSHDSMLAQQVYTAGKYPVELRNAALKFMLEPIFFY